MSIYHEQFSYVRCVSININIIKCQKQFNNSRPNETKERGGKKVPRVLPKRAFVKFWNHKSCIYNTSNSNHVTYLQLALIRFFNFQFGSGINIHSLKVYTYICVGVLYSTFIAQLDRKEKNYSHFPMLSPTVYVNKLQFRKHFCLNLLAIEKRSQKKFNIICMAQLCPSFVPYAT